MRKEKYFVWIILIVLAVVITQELSFSSLYSADAVFPSLFVGAESGKIKEITEYCNKIKPRGTYIVVRNSANGTLTSTESTYYVPNERAAKILNEHNIAPGNYSSLINESLTIKFSDYFEDGAACSESSEILFVSENASLSDSALAEKAARHFGGDFNVHPSFSENYKTKLLFSWLILGLISVFFTFLELALKKKEFLIRAINGESKTKMFLVYSGRDILFLFSLFLLSFYLSFRFYNLSFFFKEALASVALISLANSLLWTSLFFSDTRKSLAGAVSRQNLNFGAVARSLTASMAILLLAISFSYFAKSISFKRAELFYLSKQLYNTENANFVKINSDKLNRGNPFSALAEINKMYCDIFAKQYKSGTAPILLSREGSYDKNTDMLIANEQASAFIKNAFPETKNADFIIFIPKKREKDKLIRRDTAELKKALKESPETVVYENRRTVCVADSEFNDLTAENPVLVYCNMSVNPQKYAELFFKNNYDLFSNTLIILTEKQKDELFLSCGLNKNEIDITDASELYAAQSRNQKHSAVGFFVLAVLASAAYISVNKLIAAALLSLNSKEIGIKKALGYRPREIFGKTALKFLGLDMFSALIPFLLLHFELITTDVKYMIFSAALICLISFISLFSDLRRELNKNISQALKEGTDRCDASGLYRPKDFSRREKGCPPA